MSSLPNSLSQDVLPFFRERIAAPMRMWQPGEDPQLSALLNQCSIWCTPEQVEAAGRFLTEQASSDSVEVFQLTDESALVAAAVPNCEDSPFAIMALVAGPPDLGKNVLRNSLEAWDLSQQVALSHTALEESAMQLAQSYEEQNWLRGFARNASSISKVANANEIANSILQPLGYLLRAEDVFLIVHPEETERSGLISAKYGESDFSVETISRMLVMLGLWDFSAPLVRNNLELNTPDGTLKSIVGVAVTGSEQSLGYLVGINRKQESGGIDLPVYDQEFGSSDVGLLEEAAVLLTTQAQNILLLVQSNQLFLGTLHAMSSAIDARDKYTQGHSERVARLSYDLARILGLSEEACQEIYLSGILHDIGKIGVPDKVLLKNGPLTDEEFDIIRQHPEIGHRIVEQLGHLQFALPGVLYHHERWDGKGYPHGLSGISIPLMARIMAVADAFDAMTSSRPYRSAMPVEKAHHIIRSGAAEQWDAEIVNCFEKWLSKHSKRPAEASPHGSIIPQDAPMEQMVQAVMTLVQ